ncbi:MAG: sulfatase-like hydrolase/transferase [Saprospiraceae bacterium]|nr:sulfatase-like hydrolase/transferase [Lewinella sp.]
MRKTKNLLFILFISSLIACRSTGSESTGQSAKHPNIVYILADDLGYGELGVYGQQQIETPNIDALAQSGMLFTQHYSGAPVCAPARCVLLTGQHGGHAYVRGNDEWGERGKVWDYQAMFDDPFLEGQRPLPDSIVTVAELLQSAGYTTGAFGKWGLGAPTTEGVPNKQGFDTFYGYNCQRQAHTFYPMHLWKNEERDLLDNKFVELHANLQEGADPNDPASYADFQLNEYAPDLIHREVLQFIEDNKDEPFFLYYPSIIPHLPLQGPQEWVEHYEKKFGPEEPFTGTSYFPNRTPRATYAAMISYLDQQVGEVVAKLKELGLYENTLIIFSSDNGPTYVGGVDADFFNSAGPFQEGYGFTKGFVSEGGIRVPMIAAWPGHIEPGTTTEHISAFYDVLPTLCDVAGVDVPDNTDGISFLPVLEGKEQPEHEYLYWEFPSYTGQQAVRMGNWKAVRKNIFAGNTDIELYDLSSDPLEQENVAGQHPDIVNQIKTIMTSAHRPATLDRFMMEPLGDVPAAYLEARARAEKQLASGKEGSLQDGYFTIRPNTALLGSEMAPAAIARLQQQLKQTGGYQLKTGKKTETNALILQKNLKLPKAGYDLQISPERILLEAADAAGFEQGIQQLLQLMDEKIWQEKEMHQPTWMVASVEIS